MTNEIMNRILKIRQKLKLLGILWWYIFLDSRNFLTFFNKFFKFFNLDSSSFLILQQTVFLVEEENPG